MTAHKVTPMFEQYLRIKEEHPDALLFFRMGDFYEMFFEDAEQASRALSITLTARRHGDGPKIPMCGVPHHSAENYLKKLLEQGFRVAICDQMEDPRQAKGLVKRAVTRVLTPGTVVEDSSLSAKDHNFLAALYWDADKGAGGLAWVDASIGSWTGIHSKREEDLWRMALKIQPRELLITEDQQPDRALTDAGTTVNRLVFRGHFDPKGSEKRLLRNQSAASLAALDLHDKPQLVQACGALLAYLEATQKTDVRHLASFKVLNQGRHCIIDEVTERNLELFQRMDGKGGPGTLVHVLDRTLTPMGGRLLRQRLRYPWREVGAVNDCADTVELFHRDDGKRRELREALDSVYDMERLATRIFMDRCMPKDFVSLRQSLEALPGLSRVVRGFLEGLHEESDAEAEESNNHACCREMGALLRNWDDLADFYDVLDRALVDNPPPVITEGGLFKPGYHAELDELLELTEHGESKLHELFERERDAHDLPKLKLGFNRVFGHYFELSRTASDTVPDHFIRRQTLRNSERFTTEELGELEAKLTTASDKRKDLEYQLFRDLREQLAAARHRFLFMADVVAAVDYWQGLAEAARRWNWARPELHDGPEIEIVSGRHPVVEAVQGSGDFIPNDLRMDADRRILLITGPNMAGKSTVLRQAALMCVLAQMGSFVPATSARIGVVDRVFCRVGASDNLAQGQSTFMVEMIETARILRQAGKRSLVILDEIGRGTSTFDGLSLAWAVVEELSRRGRGGIRCLFATHYHELTVLEGTIDGVRNMNIAVKEWGGEIVFLRRLVPGPSDRSYGIEVAKLAGVPRPVVQRAKEILTDLEDKARKAGGHSGPRSREAQPLLPGFFAVAPGGDGGTANTDAAASADAERHPLLDELAALSVDSLTPIEALNYLHRWKKDYGNHED